MLKNQRNKGITLIALVVSIIILLILAGISISTLSGNNSILQRAGEAKINTENASLKEQVLIAVLGSYETNANLNVNKLKSNLEEIGATVIGDSFPITATISGKKYTIENNGNVQEINENVITIAELKENASTYFGYDVINYAETLPSSLQDTEWQLFYAGALDGETEERIYLISKEYVKNAILPAKNRATPLPASDSDYRAYFSTWQNNSANINDGVCNSNIYAGSSDIISNMQKYNKDYFITKNYSSSEPNMRAVAYMLDTTIWSSFATSSENFAEWAIGGPTVELLFTAYNRYKGLTGNTAYVAEAKSATGYQISKDGGNNYVDFNIDSIENDTSTLDSPYSVSNLSNTANGYWLASPSNYMPSRLLYVGYNGSIFLVGYSGSSFGFRPLVLLNSNFQLEKTTSGGKEVFQIVPKT